MRIFFLLVMVFFSNTASSQKKIADLFDKKIFACDTGFTQLKLNICSGEKAEYADSLLNNLYKKIVRHLNKQIQLQDKALSNKNIDSSERKFTKRERDYYYLTKQALVRSQQQWINFRKADCELERVGCEGGTACNYIVNTHFIEMTLDRIRALEEFDLYE